MKILGCDFDGTLNYGGIDEEKRRAIEKWRKAGNKIGVISGRPPQFAKTLQEEYRLSLDFFVAFNGGVLLNSDGEEIYRAICTDVNVNTLIEDLFSWGCEFAHTHCDKYYLIQRKEKDVREGEYLLKDTTLPPTLCQVSVALPSVKEAKRVTALINAKYGNSITAFQNERCIDIVPKGVDKAQGMYRVMEFYQAKQNDVLTVGDNANDMDMLQSFRSYAMKNGIEEVKKIATHITESVTELIYKELG